jgi:hypothetical protein
MSRVTTIAQSTSKSSSQVASQALIAKSLAKCKAEKHAKKIMATLEEIASNQQEKKSSKSFDDFLNEL